MMEKCNGEAQRTDAALQKRHGMFQRLQIKQERDQTRRESNATKQFKQNGKVWRASYEKGKSSEDRAKKKKFHNQKENARTKRSKILKCLQRTNACKDWKKKLKIEKQMLIMRTRRSNRENITFMYRQTLAPEIWWKQQRQTKLGKLRKQVEIFSC